MNILNTNVLQQTEKPLHYLAAALPEREQRWLLEVLAVSYSTGLDIHFAIEWQYPDGWPDPDDETRLLGATENFEQLLTRLENAHNWERLRLLRQTLDLLEGTERLSLETGGYKAS